MATIATLTHRFNSALKATGLTQQETADYLMVTRREVRAWLDTGSPKVPTRAHLRRWAEKLPDANITLLPKTANAAGAKPSVQTEASWWRLRAGLTQEEAAEVVETSVSEYAKLEHSMVYGLPDGLGWLVQMTHPSASDTDGPQTLFDTDDPQTLFDPDAPVSDIVWSLQPVADDPPAETETVEELLEHLRRENCDAWAIIRWVEPETAEEARQAIDAYNALCVESDAARAAHANGFTPEQMQEAFGKSPRGLSAT